MRVTRSFPSTLRRLREERFLTQRELALKAGLHALTVTRLEAGRSAPYANTVRRLAVALGVEPQQLAGPDEVARRESRRPEMK